MAAQQTAPFCTKLSSILWIFGFVILHKPVSLSCHYKDQVSHTTRIYETVPASAPASLCDCCVLDCSALVTIYLQHMYTYVIYRSLSFKKLISCSGILANSPVCDVAVLQDCVSWQEGWSCGIPQKEVPNLEDCSLEWGGSTCNKVILWKVQIESEQQTAQRKKQFIIDWSLSELANTSLSELHRTHLQEAST